MELRTLRTFHFSKQKTHQNRTPTTKGAQLELLRILIPTTPPLARSEEGNTMPTDRIIITLADAAGPHEKRPAEVRLRAVLKLLLRGFGLRCVGIRVGR